MSKIAKFPVQEGLSIKLEISLDQTLITTPLGSVSLEPDSITVEIGAGPHAKYIDLNVLVDLYIKHEGY